MTPRARDPKLTEAFCLASLVIGFAMRLFWLDTHSLWLDEGFTLYVSQASDLGETLRDGSNPPLSFWLFRLVASVFDIRTEWGLRLVPALISCAALLTFFAIAHRFVQNVRARAAALLLYACCPFLVWYAHEYRMYALFELSSLLAIWSLCLLRDGRLRAAMAWIFISASVGLGNHYFGAFPILSAVFCGVVLWQRHDLSGHKFASFAAAAILGISTWTYWLLEILPSQLHGTWGAVGQFSLQGFLETPFRLIFIQMRFLPQNLVLIALGLWGIVLLMVLLRASRSVLKRCLDSNDAFLWIFFLSPIAGALLVSALIQPRFVPRYMIACTAPLILLAGRTLFRSRAVAPQAVLCALLTVLCCTMNLLLNRGNLKDGFREACVMLSENRLPGDRIGACTMMPAGYSETAVKFYLRSDDGSTPEVANIRSMDDFKSLAEGLEPGQRIHLLLRWKSYSSGLIKQILVGYDTLQESKIIESVQWVVLHPREGG